MVILVCHLAVWIGLNDIEQEGDWRWAAGNRCLGQWSRWYANTPSNSGGVEHCGVAVNGPIGKQWDDQQCGDNRPALCQQAP